MIPSKVFIVPYRNRIQHKHFFCNYMTNVILKGHTDYEIYFSHQADTRNFNRGGIKDIGFLAVKSKYPDNYRDMTFIFNDIDTIPFTNLFDYETTPGVVKHYYGFKYALGGIVVIKGEDFERINGYPCYWGWGNEDNCLQDRCLKAKIHIDRSVFYPIGNPNILQLFDGMTRLISKKDPWRYKHDTGRDGLSTITGLTYTIDGESSNFNDNIYAVNNPRIFYVNATNFNTMLAENGDDYFKYDLREPSRQIINPNKLEMVIGNKRTNERVNKESLESMNDWSYIPEAPNAAKNVRLEVNNYQNYAKQLDAEIHKEQHGLPQHAPSPSPLPYQGQGQVPHPGFRTRPANPIHSRAPPPPPQTHQNPKNNLFRPSPVVNHGGKPSGMRFM
jgi:hypothetical protein